LQAFFGAWTSWLVAREVEALEEFIGIP